MIRSLSYIAGLLFFMLFVFGVGDYIIDDTFIHLQYAKNLRAGEGLVFNVGDAVPGTTSPLWTFSLGFVPTFGLGLLELSKLLSFAFGLMSFALIGWCAARFNPSGYYYGAVVLAWGVNAWMVRWTPTGMETTLAVFFVLSGWLAAFQGGEGRPRAWRRLATGLLWGLGSLTRPEIGILLGCYLGAVFLWPNGRGKSGDLRERFQAPLVVLVGVLIALAPYALYSLATFGSMIPGTLAAKSAGGMGLSIAMSRLIHSAKVIGAVCGVEVLALLVLSPLLPRIFKRGDFALHIASLGWLVLIPLGYAIRGVPVISRYLVPLLPILLLYGWALIDEWRISGNARQRRVVMASALVVALVANSFVYFQRVRPHAMEFVEGMERTLIPWGRWLAENTEPGTIVATPDIGAIGYYSNREVLDLGGLVTPEIVSLMRRMPYDEMVRSFSFALVKKPDYLVDRGKGPARLTRESPFGPALTPIFSGRTQSLGISMPGAIDYTLYEIDWQIADSLATRAELAARNSP